jgi:hypothetical protein
MHLKKNAENTSVDQDQLIIDFPEGTPFKIDNDIPE